MVQFATVFASLLDRETPGPVGRTYEETHRQGTVPKLAKATQKPN